MVIRTARVIWIFRGITVWFINTIKEGFLRFFRVIRVWFITILVQGSLEAVLYRRTCIPKFTTISCPSVGPSGRLNSKFTTN